MSLQTCTIHPATMDRFKALRFRKDKTLACLLLKIDTEALMVIEDEFLEGIDIAEVQDSLGSSPRYMIVSFELNHKDGRVSYPIVGIYYNPVATSTTLRMLYASSSALVFGKAEIAGRIFEISNPEDLTLEWMVEQVQSSKTRP